MATIVAVVGTAISRWSYRNWLADREIARIAAAGEPVSAEDLAAMSRLPVGTPDATDAWRRPLTRLHNRALGRGPFSLAVFDGKGELAAPDRPWSEYDQAKQFINKYAALYAEIDKAIAEPGECAFLDDYSGGYQTTLLHAQESRTVIRLLVLRAYVQQQEADAAGVVRSFNGIFHSSQILRHDPFIVSQLIRMMNNHLGIVTLANLLPRSSFTDAQLAELQASLLGVDYHPGVIRAVMGERVQGMTAFNNPTTAGADHVPGPIYQMWVDDDPYHHLMVMGELVDAAKQDWPKMLSSTLKHASQPNNSTDVRGPLGYGQWEVPSAIAGGTRGFFERSACETARLRSAGAGVAAMRFHLTEGQWPRSWEELVPKWLDAVPIDPCTGEALRFKFNQDGVTVYSVGVDGRDDGGVETPVNENGGAYLKGTPDVVFTVKSPAKSK